MLKNIRQTLKLSKMVYIHINFQFILKNSIIGLFLTLCGKIEFFIFTHFEHVQHPEKHVCEYKLKICWKMHHFAKFQGIKSIFEHFTALSILTDFIKEIPKNPKKGPFLALNLLKYNFFCCLCTPPGQCGSARISISF